MEYFYPKQELVVLRVFYRKIYGLNLSKPLNKALRQVFADITILANFTKA